MKRAALAAVVVLGVWSAVVLTRLPEPQKIPRSGVAAPTTAVERGKQAYEEYGCAICHGADGKSGIKNPNSETGGKIPDIAFVKEGYTTPELARYLLRGNPKQGKEKADGPPPPFRMPGGTGHRMTRAESSDLAQYLMSIYPKDAKSDKW